MRSVSLAPDEAPSPVKKVTRLVLVVKRSLEIETVDFSASISVSPSGNDDGSIEIK